MQPNPQMQQTQINNQNWITLEDKGREKLRPFLYNSLLF